LKCGGCVLQLKDAWSFAIPIELETCIAKASHVKPSGFACFGRLPLSSPQFLETMKDYTLGSVVFLTAASGKQEKWRKISGSNTNWRKVLTLPEALLLGYKSGIKPVYLSFWPSLSQPVSSHHQLSLKTLTQPLSPSSGTSHHPDSYSSCSFFLPLARLSCPPFP
jgi:hypothetical protein